MPSIILHHESVDSFEKCGFLKKRIHTFVKESTLSQQKCGFLDISHTLNNSVTSQVCFK